ncbi:DoxX family protein [Cerasicoccus maritimus]|uniref:DoxX family protein n=1 Tax=Cerasicoccus maritimus TaxID=490089 RepID=UPI0028529C2E|nr:hypothetical protein [Cerasicoccus maritimus]
MTSSPTPLTKRATITSWIFQLVPAVILLQTLYFKFTAAPETVYIFKVVGLGAPGRIGTGVVELIAGICLLIPRFAWLGAALAMGTLVGAIAAHLGPLGITFEYPGGYEDGSLFAMACIAWLSSAVVLFIRRKSIPIVGAKYFGA